MYCAIIGDIMYSQESLPPERDIMQRKLEHLLDDVNKRFSEHISANFCITLGDEFQGLLHESACCLPVIWQIIMGMYPVKIRFGIGIGDIYTAIDPAKALGADGSAYHFARKAVTALKSSEPAAKFPAPGASPVIMVRFETGAADTALLNLSCGFIQGIMSKWSEKQWKTIKALIENGYRQKDAADYLGLAESTVSRNLQAARYWEYHNILSEISSYLRDTFDTTVTASVRLQQAKNLISSAEYLTNVQIDYDLALTKHQEALALREAVLSSPNVLIAESLDYVGELYLKKGHGEVAREYFEKALKMRKNIELAEQRDNLAKSYRNIGQAFQYMQKYQDAFLLYKEAMLIQEDTLGKTHIETAKTYNGIAEVLYEQGEYEEALKWHHKVLSIRKNALGEIHPDTATTYHNLANVYHRLGNYAEALEWYKRALIIRENALGKNHPDTAATYYSIASIHYSKGDYIMALELYHKALNIWEKVLGKKSFQALGVNDALSRIYDKLEKQAVAENGGRQYAIFQKI